MIDVADADVAAANSTSRRVLSGWPAVGPAMLAALLTYRTMATEGLEPAIGLSIAAAMIAIAWAAFTRRKWAAPLLFVGPIALVTSPAGTELSFNLARPGDAQWYVFTVLVCVSAGFSLAGAAALVAPASVGRWIVALLLLIGSFGFSWLLVTVDPQPDLGRDLSADEVDALADVALVNYAFGLPSDGLVDDVDGEQRLRARLVNTSDLPHTFTIESLDVDVYVPAGREALFDVGWPDRTDTVRVICLVGEHAQLGMVTDVTSSG